MSGAFELRKLSPEFPERGSVFDWIFMAEDGPHRGDAENSAEDVRDASALLWVSGSSVQLEVAKRHMLAITKEKGVQKFSQIPTSTRHLVGTGVHQGVGTTSPGWSKRRIR